MIPYLTKLGFDIVGYGCMTCIGNSGPLPDVIVENIEKVKTEKITFFILNLLLLLSIFIVFV